MNDIGVPGVFENNSNNHFELQPSDRAQVAEENRLLEESLIEDGLGITGGQFFPPDPDSDIGRDYFSSVKNSKLSKFEQQRTVNMDSSDLGRSEFLSS